MRRPFSRLALRALLALAGPVTAPDTEQVLRHGVCPSCGAWRCPGCGWLIIKADDHGPYCPRRKLSHPGGK